MVIVIVMVMIDLDGSLAGNDGFFIHIVESGKS
jgi:hypothetical protein